MLDRARAAGLANVFPIGAITKSSEGKELAEIGDLRRAGCVAISDDGKPVMNSLVMRRAMEYARAFDVPVVDHCEDLHLSEGGCMNEGPSRLSWACLGFRRQRKMSWWRAMFAGGTDRGAAASGAYQHRRLGADGAGSEIPRAQGHGRSLPASFYPHGRNGPRLQHPCENESSAEDQEGCAGDQGRTPRRDHRRHRDRPCPACDPGKTAGIYRSALRHRRPGDGAAVDVGAGR